MHEAAALTHRQQPSQIKSVHMQSPWNVRFLSRKRCWVRAHKQTPSSHSLLARCRNIPMPPLLLALPGLWRLHIPQAHSHRLSKLHETTKVIFLIHVMQDHASDGDAPCVLMPGAVVLMSLHCVGSYKACLQHSSKQSQYLLMSKVSAGYGCQATAAMP